MHYFGFIAHHLKKIFLKRKRCTRRFVADYIQPMTIVYHSGMPEIQKGEK